VKAFLLAAGLGTRLRPITDELPKCLVPIQGTPLLQIWLDLFQQHGVTEVLANTHYLQERIVEFSSRRTSRTPKLHLVHEGRLLGSAGTLAQNWDFVADEPNFLVCYADNLTNMHLGKLMDFHQSHSGLISMALFQSSTPKECGIVELDDSNRIVNFEEKPRNPKSNLANGVIYVMRNRVRSYLPDKLPADIGFDLLPRCSKEMYGWLGNGLLIDIGSPPAYGLAQRVWNPKV